MRHARAGMLVGIANSHWRGKHSRHSRRMRKPRFYVPGKRPIDSAWFLCHGIFKPAGKIVLQYRHESDTRGNLWRRCHSSRGIHKIPRAPWPEFWVMQFTLGVGFSISICRLTSMRVMLSHSHLLFIMEIPISGNTVFILNLGPVIPVCNGGNYRSNDGMQIWGLYGRRNGLRHSRNWHKFATYWTTYQYVDLNVFHIVQGNLLLANGS